MRKLNFLFSKLCLVALLALPAVLTGCSDDDNEVIGSPKIVNVGISNDTIVAKGESVKIEPILNMTEPVTYSWSQNGTEVSTESSYTFTATAAGTYEIVFKASNPVGADQTQIRINVRSYQGGFYVVNEGWFGHDPGSVCYYNGKKWDERIFLANNPEKTLGATTADGIIAYNQMYFISKVSPFLVQIDLNSFKQQGIIEDIPSLGQANSFCTISEKWGVLTTTEGAYSVSLNPLGLGNKLSQADNSCEDIIQAGNYVFILSQNDILVYNAKNMTFVKTLKANVQTGFVQTKDGSLWAAGGNTMVRINITTLTTEDIQLPDGVKVNYNSMAYTPSCLSPSPADNAFYFVKADGWSSKEAYKYDIAGKTITKVVTAPAGYSFYGAGLAVNPHTGNVYATFTEDGWGDHYKNNKIIVTDEKKGTSETIDYSGTFWFPSVLVFE